MIIYNHGVSECRGVTAPFFHYILQHYYISNVLHALVLHKIKHYILVMVSKHWQMMANA